MPEWKAGFELDTSHFKSEDFPTPDELVAACKLHVGDKPWPDDSWTSFESFDLNLWLDEENRPRITCYVYDGNDTNTTCGISLM